MVKLIVEPIPPIYACCDGLITASDVASASRFQNERRRTEHLAWRRILRRELGRGVTIEYNEVGAPTVDTPDTYISVAHSREWVALAISNERVGIDIESSLRNYKDVKERYMSPEELAMSHSELWPAMVWTAKEAMYKLYGRKGIDLRDDLHVVDYDPQAMRLVGVLDKEAPTLINISTMEENMVVAVATIAHN